MRRYSPVLLFLFFLSAKAFSQNNENDQSNQNDFQNYANTESSRNYTGSFMPVFSLKENTVGRRYLFDKWVDGRVTSKDNILINTDSVKFNYDKIAGKLLAIQAKKNIIEVDDDLIKSFTLINGNDSVTFEKVPTTGENVFMVQLVADENHYSLYKSLKTHFEKANFQTNGLFESGKKYDEFVDQSDYYIVMPGQKEFKKVALKVKSIKQALPAEKQKVKNYFSKINEDPVPEIRLVGLVFYLNE